MSINTNVAYSTSLKRMLGFKLFPDINPEKIKVTTQRNQTEQGVVGFLQEKKTDHQILKMKKQISQARQKQRVFEKQIDTIVNRMMDEGLVTPADKKLKKFGSKYNLRIIPETHIIEQKQKNQTITKFPSVQKSQVKRKRHKTQIQQKQDQNKKYIYEPVNAQKYIKHYRAGMSSLKQIKIKPLH